MKSSDEVAMTGHVEEAGTRVTFAGFVPVGSAITRAMMPRTVKLSDLPPDMTLRDLAHVAHARGVELVPRR